MIIARLRGGLGNQMFQYAFAVRIARDAHASLKLDLSWFSSPGARSPKREYDLGIFACQPRIANILDLISVKTFGAFVRSQDAGFDEMPSLGGTSSAYLDGFWQNAAMVGSIEGLLRHDFRFKDPIPGSSDGLAKRIASCDSVCVNVRRGDFISDGKFVGAAYYEEAIRRISARLPRARFFVFSDDIEWCEKNLGFIPRAEFVGHEHAGEKFGAYLQLMSSCAHFIIPNSTFAWWAAWLSVRPGKLVIAPKEWSQGTVSTRGIIPDGWLKI